LLYRPDVSGQQPNNLNLALEMLGDAEKPPPGNLLPILPVDDASIACAVCPTVEDADQTFSSAPGGQVVRWHLGNIRRRFQGALLDTDAETYVRSVAAELTERERDLEAMNRIAERYQQSFVARGKRPRSYVIRPVQVACQNVIIGLATFQHESTFDGLRVQIFLTCEAPHLATHEANRALTALMLCDAFQNGGTMEIRFGERRRERPVPHGLKRFARCHGFEIGVEDRCAISPAEARQLFLAVTPMPDGLWCRALDFLDRGLASPERLCFTLLSPVWHAIELDYLLATCSRVTSILGGGVESALRHDRLAELEVARAAVMIGVLCRRLDGTHEGTRSDDEIHALEDDQRGITWTLDGDMGAVALSGLAAGRVPWSSGQPVEVGADGDLLVIPRALPGPGDWALVSELQAQAPGTPVVLLVPSDMRPTVRGDLPLLLYPDRLGEIDAEIDARLLRARVSRS
jgi:hypothetical protein